MLLVVPSSQPAKLESYVLAHLKDRMETAQVSGDFVLIGGRRAVEQAAATSVAQSLASSGGYSSSVAQIGGDQLATIYARPRPLVEDLLPLLKGSGAGSRAQIATAIAKVPASASAIISVGAGTDLLRLDVVTHGFPKSATNTTSAADVGSLPGSSWLALAANISPRAIGAIRSALPSALGQAQGRTGAAGTTIQGFLPFIGRDLIPALGPISLSVSGSSIGGLQAGVVMTPDDAAAGTRLFGSLQQMLKSVPVLTSRVGKQLVVSFGYADLKDLLSPSTPLSSDATYQAALAQLPSGSRVPFYMNFGPVAALGSALDRARSDASVWRTARRLRYLIVGGTGTDLRIVLAVR